MIESILSGVLIGSGWVAAFAVAIMLYRLRGRNGDLRVERAINTTALEHTRADLEREKEQHEFWRTRSAELEGKVADLEAERLANAPANQLGDLSSRGPRVQPDTSPDGPGSGDRGPVPEWYDPDTSDPDVSG